MESDRGAGNGTAEGINPTYEGFNPLYIESLLRKDSHELLEWLRASLLELGSVTVPETQYYADQERHGMHHTKSTLLLGIRILDRKCVLFGLVLKEIRSRLEAVSAEARDAPTLSS